MTDSPRPHTPLWQLTMDEVRAMAMRREPSPCRGCGEPIVWIAHPRTGRLNPMVEDPERPGMAINHFATCPAKQQFRRERAR